MWIFPKALNRAIYDQDYNKLRVHMVCADHTAFLAVSAESIKPVQEKFKKWHLSTSIILYMLVSVHKLVQNSSSVWI